MYNKWIAFHYHRRLAIVITAICCICSRYARWFVRGLRTTSEKLDWGYHGAVHLAIAAREAGQAGRMSNTYTATMCTQADMTTAQAALAVLILRTQTSTTMTRLSSITITGTDTSLLTGVVKRPAVNHPPVNLTTSFNTCIHSRKNGYKIKRR